MLDQPSLSREFATCQAQQNKCANLQITMKNVNIPQMTLAGYRCVRLSTPISSRFLLLKSLGLEVLKPCSSILQHLFITNMMLMIKKTLNRYIQIKLFQTWNFSIGGFISEISLYSVNQESNLFESKLKDKQMLIAQVIKLFTIPCWINYQAKIVMEISLNTCQRSHVAYFRHKSRKYILIYFLAFLLVLSLKNSIIIVWKIPIFKKFKHK